MDGKGRNLQAILGVMKPESRSRGPDWELYAAHREQFTQAVVAAAPPSPGRLCVLGAGKCNDLDLSRLTQAYREVHLVDLEPPLLASALAREEPEVRSRLKPHAPVDLSLLSVKRSSKWQRQPPNLSELTAAASSSLQGLLTRLPGPFDVVVSACVMTQLGFALTHVFPEPHRLLGPLRLAVARLHLQTLVDLTAPHGTALFVSDLVSSTHYPLSELPPDAKLDAVLRDAVAKRAFYHLAEPELVEGLLAELAPTRPLTPLTPWLWNGPLARTYLVYGLVIAADSAAG
jgi:hypothetical protein